MLKKITLCLFLCFGFVFQSCENLSNPGEAEFKNSVVFKLQTGTAKQQLYVYHTFPISFSLGDLMFSDNYSNPLAEDAKISIIYGNDVYNNFEIEYSDSTQGYKYYTNTNFLFIESNKNYSISVESNGQIIKGNVTTVGDFKILNINKLSSDDDFTVFRVRWERCENARFYRQVTTYFFSDSLLYWGTPPYKTTAMTYTYFFDIDTVSNINNLSNEFLIISQSDSMIVTIEAYDQNSYDYFIKKKKHVAVENAYGYLGSYTVKEKKIYLNNL